MANGLIERFHRQLKSALKASPHPEQWTDMLHLMLLGIRTSLKEDLQCTVAELVYGTSLRLPGEFFVPHLILQITLPLQTVTQLKHTMQVLHCKSTRKPSQSRGHGTNSLSSASHVFVRHDAVRKPVQQPYDGPFQVLARSSKFYTLDLNGPKNTVSIDRLKPAYIDVVPPVDSPTVVIPPPASIPPTPNILSSAPPPTPTQRCGRSTRLGRHVHWPAHLQDFTP